MRVEYIRKTEVATLPVSHYLLCKARQLLEPLWVGLGHIETRLLRSRLQQQPIDRPIYVTGLARAGTTITLTLLSKHPDVATHRYRDMPQPFLPYVWNRLANRLPLPFDTLQERVHKDGMMVNRDSPEAVEEAIWERFFPDLHDERRSAVFDANVHHPAFEACYRAIIGKLLLAHKRRRYLSKANYNLTRLAYLARIMPGARFVVMTRAPEAHFISWVKQHEIFLQTQARNPRWQEVIRMVGHCEFGRDNRFVNTGDAATMTEIRSAWDNGERARAFGAYWASMYGQVLDLAARDDVVRNAVLFVRYEDLCAAPHDTMARIICHAQLDANGMEAELTQHAAPIAAPGYYRAELDESEQRILHSTTYDIATRLGY